MAWKRYRKRPVEVTAEQVPFGMSEPRDIKQHGRIAVFMHSQGFSDFTLAANGGYYIKTLEGLMTADPGDFIIRGVAGEFYPCKPDIFRATYDEV